MKTYTHLFDQITTFDNLLTALANAKRGKTDRPDVARFVFHQERELFLLQAELQQKQYRPGAYKTFLIHDPKERMISAAPFRDRVVHHALCNIIAPIFEKTFIHTSYANRVGKGVHRAIEQYQEYAKQFPYVLKCDIKKFFPSVDHQILKNEIRWKIACPDTLWLCDTIIDASNVQEPSFIYFPGDDLFTPDQRPKGLPIGNLTSQFWANVYLNRFDHFIKQKLGVAGYIRYVDDFVLFGESKTELQEWQLKLTEELSKYRLLPHPHKTQIYQVKDGVPFLGLQVYPYFRYVRKEKNKRYRRHLRALLQRRAEGKLSPEKMESSLNSWLGHLKFGQSRRTAYNTFWYLRNHGVNLHVHPRGSWRVLEQ